MRQTYIYDVWGPRFASLVPDEWREWNWTVRVLYFVYWAVFLSVMIPLARGLGRLAGHLIDRLTLH